MIFSPTNQSLRGQSLPPAQQMQAMQDNINHTDSTQPTADENQPGKPASESQITILSGRLPIQLGATLGGYYDNNIYVAPNGPGKVGDLIWSFAPLVAWNSAPQTGALNSIQLVYAPTLIHYQENSQNDVINQAAQGVYGYEGDRLQFMATEQFGRYQENNADFGRLGIETSSVTRMQANYQFSPKTNAEVTARQTYISDDPGLEYVEWALASYFDYQFTPKTTIGAGGVLGAVDMQGPNQRYIQLNGRMGFNPDSKLSFYATGGVEARQTQGQSGVSFSPDFSIGAAYAPFEGANAGLNAYRRYEYSGRYYGESYLATGASASLAQRFMDKFEVTASATFEDAQYHDNFSNSFTQQEYKYFSLRPEISYTPLEGWEIRVFCQYRRSLAEGGIGGFEDRQVGASTTFTY